MKPHPVDECLIASTDLIAKTRSKLAELQFSLDTCLTRIEISADAIAASQALLAKLDGGAFRSGDRRSIDDRHRSKHPTVRRRPAPTGPPRSSET